MDAFELELKQSFLEEAAQLIEDAEACFLELERAPSDPSIMERIFRIAHNFKGSSKAVGFDELGAFTHEFESFLLRFKNGEWPVDPGSITLMLLCLDWIRSTVESLRAQGPVAEGADELVGKMKGYAPGAGDSSTGAGGDLKPDLAADAAAPEAPVEAAPSAEDPGFAEDAFSAVPESEAFTPSPEIVAAAEPIGLLSGPPDAPAAAAKPKAPPASGGNGPTNDDSIRVSVARLERLLNFVGELVILQTVLREQAVGGDGRALLRTAHQLGKVTKEVQELAMSLRMVPLKPTFQKMQRIVRDASKMLDKTVELSLEGEETEVDKTVLEALSDPLVHMIRNAVDHGIEEAAERRERGKPEHGSIALRAFHRSGRLIIEIEDDGGGIDGARLTAKAKEKGILRKDAVLSETQAINLIFHPGFSTKQQTTELSGRGVGMDVVRTNIEKLKGQVEIETRLGLGTTFRVSLPLTLAIVDAMIVRCVEERFVIPLAHVHESVRVEPDDIRKVTGFGEALLLRGETLPAIRVGAALGRKRPAGEPQERIALIVRSQGRPFAALVDDIVSQHQVVVKKLGNETKGLRQYSGSAILGDGRPALIVEIAALAVGTSASASRPAAAA